MSEGFEVEIEMPKSDINRLLKKYKKLKRYQKSPLFAVKTMDGIENIISKMIKEVEDNPL
jgi:hypothetical protein